MGKGDLLLNSIILVHNGFPVVVGRSDTFLQVEGHGKDSQFSFRSPSPRCAEQGE